MYRRALLSLFLFGLFSSPLSAQAAALSLSPNTGTFTVGSTFDLSIFIDSNGQNINAVAANLQFPPDKLQLVSPTVGKSVVGVWVTAPQFNNQTGQINLEGVIPGGLKTSQGLLTTLTFRVKSVGQAVVKFLNQSKVLLNDGIGTDSLANIQNGIYQLILPPPAGPIVTSSTHPDQTKWQASNNPVLAWAAAESDVQGYSYVLSDEPLDVPDDVSEGDRTSVSYRDLSEGRHYFHIKALRSGAWGDTTHFALLVDKTPPAEFPVQILPGNRTTSLQPVIQFSTTDNSSGLDHYELRLISLQPQGEQALFIESSSPYVPPALKLGNYDVILRAYDVAGNYREVVQRLEIVTPIFRFISSTGLVIKNKVVITWPWLLGGVLLLLILLGYLATRLRLVHFHLHRRHVDMELPAHVHEQLSELEKYRERYGKALMILLIILSASLFTNNFAHAATSSTTVGEPLSPPIVTTISRQISNQEIFYLGGKSDSPNSQVVIYLQNPATGELTSVQTATDQSGEWFYRHDTFLPAGGYLLWTQIKRGNELSPPGPQLGLAVSSHALQLGASRLSYEAIYLLIICLLVLGLIILVTDLVIHAKKVRHKKYLVREQIREAEESLKRGFAVLRRDIQAELKATREESAREKLLADLEKVEKYIGKELWDVKKAGYN